MPPPKVYLFSSFAPSASFGFFIPFLPLLSFSFLLFFFAVGKPKVLEPVAPVEDAETREPVAQDIVKRAAQGFVCFCLFALSFSFGFLLYYFFSFFVFFVFSLSAKAQCARARCACCACCGR